MIYDLKKLYNCGYILFIPITFIYLLIPFSYSHYILNLFAYSLLVDILILNCFYHIIELYQKYNDYILKKALN